MPVVVALKTHSTPFYFSRIGYRYLQGEFDFSMLCNKIREGFGRETRERWIRVSPSASLKQLTLNKIAH